MEKTAINVSEWEIDDPMDVGIDLEIFVDGELSKSLRRRDSIYP